MTPQEWVGKTIGGRYQIEALLGQGGMSAVYRANDPNLRRLVAIKLIHAHLSNDPNFIGRFKEEAAAVARLRHPNIVQVHDFNIDGDTYYMVMEYLVGETLQTRLKRLNATGRRMPLEEAVGIILQVCEAAGYAHKHELVHRDIKPANVMLNVNGQAILMDFGIVKIIGGDYHTATGATIGTAMYMSPEQIRSERADERADIYSLGVTLYEMLSGRPPYMADSALTLMMMVINDPLPDLSEIRQDIPVSLKRVVEKALAKEPDDRFQSMAEMAAALRAVQAELAQTPPQPAATLVDEPDVEPVGSKIVSDHFTEAAIPSELEAVPSAAMPTEADLQQPGDILPPVAAPPVATLEGSPESITHRQPRTWLTAGRIRSRIVLTGISVVVLVIVTLIGIQVLNARKPPNLLLSPVNLPTIPVNAQTARGVVSLAKWETDSSVEELAYSPDGNLLGTANHRDWVRYSQYKFYTGLWQVQPGILEKYLLGPNQWVSDVAFSPDGRLFGSAADDGSLWLWQVVDGKLVRKIESEHGGLTSLDFSPNNLLLAAGAWDGSLSLWQLSNGNLLRTLRINDFGLKDLAFSPDSALLAAASDDNSILVWRVSDGSLQYTLQGHTAPASTVVFSPDGTLLASASDDFSIKVWQLSDGSMLHSLSGHSETVYDVAFSPDGSLLASGSGDGTLRLWRVSDGALITTLIEYSDGINSVVFSPEGFLLVSSAADGAIQFWGISEAIPLDNQ